MTTMPATAGHNEACCNIPPVVWEGYKAKGDYVDIGGFKTYVTGPSDATKVILFIFDIFGFRDQTLQGADILATSDDHHKYLVVIPDWFHDKPAKLEWFPPTDDDKKAKLGSFFESFSPQSVAAKVPDYMKAVKEKYPSIKSCGCIGACWGGKVATLATSDTETNPFAVAASVHPGFVDAADAPGIKVPFILLSSEEEPDDKVQAFGKALSVPHHVERFGDQIHGWMGARAQLAVPRNREEYERGYKTVLTFFGKHWA